ncbi:small GTP-binding protein, putative [Trichomonas vaginalis G3]|uniref:Small GTP-binding protein, putative n=2 Tax=Trichomonas vaginalis TaxID=5722 RepID=A0A8U0WQ18_TRIV3|nr:small Rab GTPase Rab5a [Trichomonas vaginalis G3]AAY83815.1 small Rab GTPase Rab5a [Trichomonas vaginalis]EAY11587.1 small GTP-binding protein, putative [Trichomonas vaginalis G3]KAI5516530.1 small Rab GTPase Rab5a [Trichomonas vaginalis G3]|eukprot:XP_001323810.1 small GTP-binding protein [Trichomonas vaginalis G3]
MLLAAGSNLKEAKVVMLGSTTVGKSSIVTMLTRGSFSESCASTIGAAFLSKTINLGDQELKLQIWDTGGSERYRAMAPMYFQNANAAIIVYDITSSTSYNDVESWLKELREKGPASIIIALAGNKSDLDQQRCVATEDAQSFAQKHGIPIFKETSALKGINIQEIFTDVAVAIARGAVSTAPAEQVTLTESNPKDKKKKCC